MAQSGHDPEASAAVTKAIASLRKGDFTLVLDDEGSCNLALAAEHATAERVAFFIRHSAGIITACMDQERLEGFGLHSAPDAISSGGSRPHCSADFLSGDPTLGATAAGRASTLKAFCNKSNLATAFSTPGHTFASCVFQRGVLEAPRCLEAAYDLCQLGRLTPVATLAQLMREDGSMFQAKDAEAFSRDRNIPLVSVRQLLAYRRSHGDLSGAVGQPGGPTLVSEAKFWMDEVSGDCMIRVYSTADKKVEIVAILKGDSKGAERVPVRIHSECFTGDILGSKRCDCGQQLHKFLSVMNRGTNGVLLYIRGHEGRGIGLGNKIRAYKLQDEGMDTVDANVHLGLPVDGRTYNDSLAVLNDLGVKTISLHTNNPEKISAMKPITMEVVAIASVANEHSMGYLTTKRRRLNHQTVLETFKLPPPSTRIDTSNVKIGIVYTTWNQYYVDELRRAAEEGLRKVGVQATLLSVPGACELVSGARALVKHAKPHAIIVIGVLIRGSSSIYDATCSAVMNGLTQLNASQDIPIIHGLLMCHDEDQAHERTHGSNNPAQAWADTALHMATLSAQVTDGNAEASRENVAQVAVKAE